MDGLRRAPLCLVGISVFATRGKCLGALVTISIKVEIDTWIPGRDVRE
jgi:hypothetical protein